MGAENGVEPQGDRSRKDRVDFDESVLGSSAFVSRLRQEEALRCATRYVLLRRSGASSSA